MTAPTPHPTAALPQDADLAHQARPGHGVPSQDPDPAAQTGLWPAEARREAGSALAGGGLVAGMATGAALGAVAGGPVGVVVGASLGGLAGVLGGAAAGTMPGEAAAAKAPAPAARV
jgi:non-heme chloroperoxidase